jgi:hypothetical protein
MHSGPARRLFRTRGLALGNPRNGFAEFVRLHELALRILEFAARYPGESDTVAAPTLRLRRAVSHGGRPLRLSVVGVREG